jgi:hypothetical protein
VPFAQSSQIVNRHGGDAANRAYANRCCRKEAPRHIFHLQISILARPGRTCILANATLMPLFLLVFQERMSDALARALHRLTPQIVAIDDQ